MELNSNEYKQLQGFYQQLRGNKPLKIVAIGGKEGDRFTYVAKISFSELSSHFCLVPEDVELPKNLKLQRDLVKTRATKIKQYLLENSDHIFPEVIGVCESIEVELIDEKSSVFQVTVPAESFRYLVDGQGRLVGIDLALQDNVELSEQTIDIKFVLSEGHKRDTQLFADVNMTPISPNKSQCAAMDSRLAVNRFAKKVVYEVPELNDRIDFTKNSVTSSSKSDKLWTLNQVVAFVLMVTGTTAKSFQKLLNSGQQQAYWIGFINKYFIQLKKHPAIYQALDGSVSAVEVRQQTIIGTSVFFKSIALMGKVIAMHIISKDDEVADWSLMDNWSSVDLSVDNSEWMGRCKNFRGGYEDKSFNHKAMASYFLMEMGLEVPEELETIEEEVLIARAKNLKAKREEAKANAQEKKTEELF